MGRLNTLREMVGVEELQTLALYRALAAEFLGTLILVLMSCGGAYNSPGDMRAAFIPGITLSVLILSFSHVSGGHFNPAVTMGTLTARYTSLIRSFLYMAVQVAGGIAGCGILYSIAPTSFQNTLGVLQINIEMTEVQAFGMELILTFILIFAIIAGTDERRKDVKGSVAIAIGLLVSANVAFGMNMSGACMNPARAIGPAVIVGDAWAWEGHWVYWAGPLVGAALASVLYSYVFREQKENLSLSQEHILQPDRI